MAEKMKEKERNRLNCLRNIINCHGSVCTIEVCKEAASILKKTIQSEPSNNVEGLKRFRCFLSGEIMVEPVVCSTGKTYEKTYIKAWMAAGFQKCPRSRIPFENSMLTPNEGLKQEIKEWKLKNKLAKIVEEICSDIEPEAETYKEARDVIFALSMLSIKKKMKKEYPNGEAESLRCPEPCFLCPICQQIMHDPVVLVDTGEMYDRRCFEAYIGVDRSCPVTRQSLNDTGIVPNFTIRGMISDWREKQLSSSHA